MTADERREDIRGVREERLFVKVLSGDSGDEASQSTIACSTLDISASGLRLSLLEPLDAGVKLEMWVEVKGCPGKFLLHGVVRWCHPKGEEFTCGIELQENDEISDLVDWQDLFA